MKKPYLIAFCLIFTLAQLWFGLGGMTMEFKGSVILMAPFRPYFANWLLLIFVVFLAQQTRTNIGKVAFILLMTLHYTITMWYVLAEIASYRASPSEFEGLGLVIARYPEELVGGAVTYILGNAFVWYLYGRKRR